MCDLDRFTKLLAQTDGRDKIYKFLGGLLKIISSFDGDESHLKAYNALGRSITDGRSLMRMVKWSGDIPKMQKIVAHCSEKKTVIPLKLIELLRVLGNFLYIIGDNIAFFARFSLLPLESKSVQAKSKVAQFWGFFFAAVLDIFALRAALLKRSSDTATSRKEMKNALISLTKDGSDALVAMNSVGYMRWAWNPSPLTSGTLTALSGAIATYQNWNKIK